MKIRRVQDRHLGFVMSVAVSEPFLTAPQAWSIWRSGRSGGVSLWTWTLYLVSAFVWLYYGFKAHDRWIVISSLLWVIADAGVVLGVIVVR